MYVSGLVNGGEVLPGGTTTGGRGMWPWVMMRVMLPSFLTLKLACSTVVSEDNGVLVGQD